MDSATFSPPTSLYFGIDVEDIDRFAEERDLRGTDLGSVFSPEEHEHCLSHLVPSRCYAVHWCVKEAAVKALWPWIHLDPRRVSLVHDGSVDHMLLLDGSPLDHAGLTARVTITRSKTTVLAVVAVSALR